MYFPYTIPVRTLVLGCLLAVFSQQSALAQEDFLLGRKAGTWYLQHRFAAIDFNGDELLDKEEFAKVSSEFPYYLDDKNFRIADRNGDMHISPNELRSALDEELIYRRVQEKLALSELTRKHTNLASFGVDSLKKHPELLPNLMGNFVWMSEHDELVAQLFAQRGKWFHGDAAAQMALQRNLTWLASNPRKAEKLYKEKDLVKASPELDKWRKAHLDFIKAEPTLRDTVYSLQLFDREKVSIEMDDNEFSAPQSVDIRIDTLNTKLRKSRAEVISLEAEVGLLKEQYRVDTDKLRDQQSLTQKQLDITRTDMARLELERQQLGNQLKAQGESLRKIAVEKEQQKATIAQQQQNISNLLTARDTLTKSIAEVRNRNTNLAATLARQKAEADTLRDHLNTAVATINKHTTTIQGLTSRLEIGTRRFDSLQTVFAQMDVERKAAIEQATGMELAIKSLEDDLTTRRATEAQAELRSKDKLNENLRQRDQINKLVAQRDSLTREVARLEVEKTVLAGREMRNRLAKSAQQTVEPGAPIPTAIAEPAPINPATVAELAEAKKKIEQMEVERKAVDEQLASNLKFVELASAEKTQLNSRVGELQSQNKTLSTQKDSLAKVLSLVQNKDIAAKLTKSNRSADSLRFELKKAEENAKKLAAANASLQEQMTRRQLTEAGAEQQKGEMLAKEQQLAQQKTALEQREAAIKAQEEKYKTLVEKEKELKQWEQRLKQQEAHPETLTPAPKPASPAPPPTTHVSPSNNQNVIKSIEVPKNSKIQKFQLAPSESLDRIITWFNGKNYPPHFEDEKLVYRGVKLPEIGSDTYNVTFFVVGPLPNETMQTLVISTQALNGEYLTEEKFPVEVLKLRMVFKRIYKP